MRGLYARHGSVMVPAGEAEKAWVRSLGEGECVWFKAERARRPRFHRLFFVMLNKIFDNQSEETDRDEFLTQTKYLAGHYDWHDVWIDGVKQSVPVVKSIDFEHMDEDEFVSFVHRAIPAALERYCPGLEYEDLRAELMDQLRPIWEGAA